MMMSAEELYKKAEKITLFLMDVDGILTDGRIIYDSDGRELKFFHVRDGHGIKLLIRHGIEAGIITGRNSTVVDKRAAELGIRKVFQNAKDKRTVIEKIISDGGYKPEQIAFMGDDIVDIPVFKRVGLRISVPDASYDVRGEVDYITLNYAGKGAVREACELILKAKKIWDTILEEYRR